MEGRMAGKTPDYTRFRESAILGLESARAVLSTYTGRPLRLAAVRSEYVELCKVSLFSGPPEEVVLSSYVTFKGDVEGQLLILFRPESAERLASLLAPHDFGQLSGRRNPALVDSFIGEVANVVGSAVLNKVADGFGIKILPIPPVMIREMAGAVLSSAMAYAGLDGDSAYVAYMKVTLDEEEASFEIVFLPMMGTWKGTSLETEQSDAEFAGSWSC
jgi:chemotaxis protein CheY-P-specific phosphatase CheC